MSLIQTAKRAGANVLDYLTRLQDHAADVKKDPILWLPWNYLDPVSLLQGARQMTQFSRGDTSILTRPTSSNSRRCLKADFSN